MKEAEEGIHGSILRREGDRRPPTPGRRALALAEVALGLAALGVSHVLLFRQVEPVASWFYCFAWWPTIILLDGVNYLREGDSLLLTRTRTAAWLLPVSVTIWLVFEVWNLRLENWSYVFVPRSQALRWAGMTVAFATVLPGIFEIADLLQSLGLPRRAAVRPFRPGRAATRILVVVGLLFLVAPLLWPRAAFPLIWGGFVFLLDPWCRRVGQPSILAEWERGRLTTFVRLLLAGLVAGGLWEFYNFWARTKWFYTVPGLEEIKLFEMPPLGFIGFPPFAVECFVMASAAPALVARLGGRRWAPALALGMILFWGATYIGVDRRTVVSHAPRLEDFSGLVDEGTLRRLEADGMTDPFLLAGRVEALGAARVAASVGSEEAEIEALGSAVRLAIHAGMGSENALALRARGVRDIGELPALGAGRLRGWLEETSGGRALPPPRPAIIRIWIRSAARAGNR